MGWRFDVRARYKAVDIHDGDAWPDVIPRLGSRPKRPERLRVKFNSGPLRAASEYVEGRTGSHAVTGADVAHVTA